MGRHSLSCRAGSLRCAVSRRRLHLVSGHGFTSTVVCTLVLVIVLSGCIHREYLYDLGREYVGLSDCEIRFYMKSVDYHCHPSYREGDRAFLFTASYHCLAADSCQELIFDNVQVLALGSSEPVHLNLIRDNTMGWAYPKGKHILEFGPYVCGKNRPDSVLISFDLIAPEGVAVGAPRSGHYEIPASLRVEKTDPFTYMTWFD